MLALGVGCVGRRKVFERVGAIPRPTQSKRRAGHYGSNTTFMTFEKK